ncbi:MAG: hypothetical protein H0Z37_06900 [Firmicutes bacterium]|nr:hypothetical protein [Bacillota bacterium]
MAERNAAGPGWVEDLEDAIERALGLTAVRVVADPTGAVKEVHVLASPTRPAGRIRRDIETMLRVQRGIRVDRRQISVAQWGGEESTGAPLLRLAAIQSLLQADGLHVEVDVGLGEQTARGAAGGPASEDNRDRLAAHAAVKALNKLEGIGRQIHVEAVRTLGFQRGRAVLVCLSVLTGGREDVVTGVAPVERDVADAAARAVLAAVAGQLSGQPAGGGWAVVSDW